ncbi:MAG: nucleoside hydrolase [Corynebacterium sp.]|nr:nucleoside hydrolase [Corynebacterium sp.]
MTAPKVLLDCDTGIDDAMAVVYLAGLHKAGEIELVGITTTSGNVEATQCARNSAYLLDLLGVEVPIAVGKQEPLVLDLVTTPETHGPTGLGYAVTPSTAGGQLSYDWQSIWENCGADLAIVTGPATNLAAYGHNPAPHVALMGGAYLYKGNTTPTAEWNSWVDPHAAKQAFSQTDSPIQVCGLEVTETCIFTPEDWEGFAQVAPKNIAEVLGDALKFYFEFHESVGVGYCAQIHDLLTCMIALDKIPYESTLVAVDVEAESPLLRGTTVADFGGVWKKEPNCKLTRSADVEAAHREFARALSCL